MVNDDRAKLKRHFLLPPIQSPPESGKGCPTSGLGPRARGGGYAGGVWWLFLPKFRGTVARSGGSLHRGGGVQTATALLPTGFGGAWQETDPKHSVGRSSGRRCHNGGKEREHRGEHWRPGLGENKRKIRGCKSMSVRNIATQRRDPFLRWSLIIFIGIFLLVP